MDKKIKKYLLSVIIMLGCLWSGFIPGIAAEKKPAGHIVISFEKATLGQGFLIEPEYVPFYENDTVADVTLRVLQEKGRKYNFDGKITSGFYLSEISDPGRGELKVPAYILDDIKKQQQSSSGLIMKEEDIFRQDGVPLYKDNTPEYLGEFDYWTQSGWMYSINGIYPKISSCDFKPQEGQIVRWQFSMVNLGIDLYGDPTVQNKIDRDDLCHTLAEARENSSILKDAAVKDAYDRCRKNAIAMDASKDDYGKDIDIIKKALGWSQLTEIRWYDTENTRCSVKNGTKEENIPFPETLRAVKSGKEILLKDGNEALSWECPEGYHSKQSGTYTFYPVIPERYSVADNVVLPAYQVTVKKLGDIDGNDIVNNEDMEMLLSCLRNRVEQDEPEAACDLNSDSVINLKDYSILAGALGNTSAYGDEDARIELRMRDDKRTADIIVYGGQIDVAAFQFDYDTSLVSDVEFEALQPFSVEKSGQNVQGSWFVLGSRTGSISASAIRGTCIGRLSFQYTGNDIPNISWGTGSNFLLEGKSAVGYCNGYSVEFDTDVSTGNDIRLTGQLNNGKVRCAQFTGKTIIENGIEMELVNLTFRYTDAEDTDRNRLRIFVQSGENSSFAIGESCVNDEIQNCFEKEENDVWLAGNDNKTAGCFILGRSPQKESCILYARLKNGEALNYYKITVNRNGYAAVKSRYSETEPFIISEWDENMPDVISAPWNIEDLDLQEWDEEGNPLEGIHVELPERSAGGKLFLNESKERIIAGASGEYWLDMIGSDGTVKGKIRVLAECPYEMVEYLLKEAKEISLKEADYHSSVSDDLKKYVSIIKETETLQQQYPENVPLFMETDGTYTTRDTGVPAKDSSGYAITSDYLRTETAKKLQEEIELTKPELLSNRMHHISAKLDKTAFIYNGSCQTPKVTVTDDEGKKVPTNGYTLTYSGNQNAGTGRVKVTGKGYYKGSCILTFTIKKASQKVIIYTGSYTTQTDASAKYVKVASSGDGELVYRSSDSSVLKISDKGKALPKKAGKVWIYIKAAEGANYRLSGEYKIQVTVKPKKIRILALKSKKSKQLTVSWEKGKKITGYEAWISTDAKFRKSVTKYKAKKITLTSKTFKNLKGGKIYFVKIRTFGTGKGGTACSGWSPVRKIKVKR